MAAYEESLCGGCSQPKAVSYNPDSEGWYEAREIICAGCAAQQEGIPGRDKKKQGPPGAKVYVVDTRPPDVELRPFRLGAGPGHDPRDDQADAE